MAAVVLVTLDLDAIEARARALANPAVRAEREVAAADMAALIAEVRRLRETIDALEDAYNPRDGPEPWV